MLTLFKPAVRRALAHNALGTHQGVLGATQTVIKQLKEHKEEAHLVKAFTLPARTTGMGKVKPGSKGAKRGTTAQWLRLPKKVQKNIFSMFNISSPN